MNLSAWPPTCRAFCSDQTQRVKDALPAIGVPTRRVWRMDGIQKGLKANGACEVIRHILGGYNLAIWETH